MGRGTGSAALRAGAWKWLWPWPSSGQAITREDKPTAITAKDTTSSRTIRVKLEVEQWVGSGQVTPLFICWTWLEYFLRCSLDGLIKRKAYLSRQFIILFAIPIHAPASEPQFPFSKFVHVHGRTTGMPWLLSWTELSFTVWFGANSRMRCLAATDPTMGWEKCRRASAFLAREILNWSTSTVWRPSVRRCVYLSTLCRQGFLFTRKRDLRRRQA